MKRRVLDGYSAMVRPSTAEATISDPERDSSGRKDERVSYASRRHALSTDSPE